MSNNITGKVVVITTVSGGLGEATARFLSAQHESIVLGARRVNPFQSLANELTGGGKTLAVPTDVTHFDQPDIVENIRKVYELAVPAESGARAVAFAITQAEDLDVNEILYRPTRQEF